MTLIKSLMVVAIMGAGVVAAEAKQDGPSLRDRQQAACYNDVQRLCGTAMPDVAKVTACMKPKKDLVSAKCRALWDAT